MNAQTTFDFSKPLYLSERLTLPTRALLSPMQGIMTSTFLQAASRLNLVDAWLTPFYSSGGVSIPKPAAVRRKIAPYRTRPEIPVIFQMIGHDAEALAETARIFAECGVEGINLNFACPSKTVLLSGNGASCLKQAGLAAKITETTARKLPSGVSLSVKIRTGWDSAKDAPQLVRDLCNAGAQWIICHYRTAMEMYQKLPDAQQVRQERISTAVNAAGDIPVFGNGDVDSFEDAKGFVRQTGCQGVAAGRAFLTNPYLIMEIGSNGFSGHGANKQEIFLKMLSELMKTQNMPKRHQRGWYLECIKMAYGENSAEFEQAIHGQGQ